MIACLGNCQAEFLANAIRSRGLPASSIWLASPLTMNGPSPAPPDRLRKLIEQEGLESRLHSRDLAVQFGDVRESVKGATLIVVNLFHEATPLHVMPDTGDAFYLDPDGIPAGPFREFLEQECRAVAPKPATYMDRFETMLRSIRDQAPGVPILLLTRLSHYPAFGPSPRSYLTGWGDIWPRAGEYYQRWRELVPDFHVLDMDRIFAGVWSRSERRIEEHCPFLKIEPVTDGQGGSRLILQRDLEHVGTVWGVLAERAVGFLRSGMLAYRPEETVPEEWTASRNRPERLTADQLQRLLASGANYFAARAVAAFFSDLGRDYTDLLVACRNEIPVCHNTLHMIRAYAALRRNPRLKLWCDAHREKLREFTANGEAYQQKYLQRIRELEGFLD
jgi:hypothetical protein